LQLVEDLDKSLIDVAGSSSSACQVGAMNSSS